jgi:hypothetical protein
LERVSSAASFLKMPKDKFEEYDECPKGEACIANEESLEQRDFLLSKPFHPWLESDHFLNHKKRMIQKALRLLTTKELRGYGLA